MLSLIEENTAAALHYGKDNVFDNKTVLYYNMGPAPLRFKRAPPFFKNSF